MHSFLKDFVCAMVGYWIATAILCGVKVGWRALRRSHR